MNVPLRLSPKSVQVLKLISEGHSYAKIVDGNPDLNYHDIFFAAEEAVWLDERLGASPETAESSGREAEHAMARAKLVHPRAYASWTVEEDGQLISLFTEGKSRKEIAGLLQRQPSAIASRLRKHGLVSGG